VRSHGQTQKKQEGCKGGKGRKPECGYRSSRGWWQSACSQSGLSYKTILFEAKKVSAWPPSRAQRPAGFPEPEIDRFRCQKDSPIDERIEKDIQAGKQGRMIEVLRVQDKEDEERQASARPDQLAHLRNVPLNCGCEDNDGQTNSQDHRIEFAAHG
jgi:hypothetical protein